MQKIDCRFEVFFYILAFILIITTMAVQAGNAPPSTHCTVSGIHPGGTNHDPWLRNNEIRTGQSRNSQKITTIIPLVAALSFASPHTKVPKRENNRSYLLKTMKQRHFDQNYGKISSSFVREKPGISPSKLKQGQIAEADTVDLVTIITDQYSGQIAGAAEDVQAYLESFDRLLIDSSITTLESVTNKSMALTLLLVKYYIVSEMYDEAMNIAFETLGSSCQYPAPLTGKEGDASVIIFRLYMDLVYKTLENWEDRYCEVFYEYKPADLICSHISPETAVELFFISGLVMCKSGDAYIEPQYIAEIESGRSVDICEDTQHYLSELIKVARMHLGCRELETNGDIITAASLLVDVFNAYFRLFEKYTDLAHSAEYMWVSLLNLTDRKHLYAQASIQDPFATKHGQIFMKKRRTRLDVIQYPEQRLLSAMSTKDDTSEELATRTAWKDALSEYDDDQD